MSGRGYPRPRGPGGFGGGDWSPYQPPQNGFSGHPNAPFNPSQQQSMPQTRFPVQHQTRQPGGYSPGDAVGAHPAQFAAAGLQRSLGAGVLGPQSLSSERNTAPYQMQPAGAAPYHMQPTSGRQVGPDHGYPYSQGPSASQFPQQQFSSQLQDHRQAASPQTSYAPQGTMHVDRQFPGQGRGQPALGASNQGMGQPAAYFAPSHLGGPSAGPRPLYDSQRAMGDPRKAVSSAQNFAPQQQQLPNSYHRSAEPPFGNTAQPDYGNPVYHSQYESQGTHPQLRERGYGPGFDSNPNPGYSAPSSVDPNFMPNGPSFSYSQVGLYVCPLVLIFINRLKVSGAPPYQQRAAPGSGPAPYTTRPQPIVVNTGGNIPSPSESFHWCGS